MIGTYKILGTFGGKFHFGSVSVKIEDASENRKGWIGVDLQPSDKIQQIYKDWEVAAVKGVLKFIRDYHEEVKNKQFLVVEILATIVDSEDDTIEFAAYMAAYSAVFKESKLPKINWDNGWQILETD